MCVCTGQSVVDHVVLVPQPQYLLLSVLDSVHADSCCLFKVLTALLAAEECPDVPTHHLQHWGRLALQTCTGKHTQGDLGCVSCWTAGVVRVLSGVCYLCCPAQWVWHHVGRSEHETESRENRGNLEALPCCPDNQPIEAPPPGTHLRSGQVTGSEPPPLSVCVCVFSL